MNISLKVQPKGDRCYSPGIYFMPPCSTDFMTQIDLNTRLKITAINGDEIVLRSRKAQALVGMLALAPDLKQDRAWLIERLWSRRAPDQARQSLRQALRQLRVALNRTDNVIGADKRSIWLHRDAVDVVPVRDLETALDWVDLPDEPGFHAWLRDVRRSVVFAAEPQAVGHASNPDVVVRILAPTVTGQAPGCAEMMDHLVCTTAAALSEVGGITVITGTPRTQLGDDLTLSMMAHVVPGELHLRAIARRADTGQQHLLFNRRMPFHRGAIPDLTLISDQMTNELCEQVLSLMISISDRLFSRGYLSIKQASLGVRALFSREQGALILAGDYFDAAVDINATGVTLAWRSYLAALALEEGDATSHALVRDRARHDIETALAQEPNNGLVHALASQIYAFVLGNFDMAGKCLRKALDYRPDSVMTQDAAALLNLYTGDLDRARKSALRAEYLGQNLPFQYCFATTLLMIETLAGNYRAGIHHGERAMALAPNAGANPYPPTLRYLGISLAQHGDVDQSRQVFSRLAHMEGKGDEVYMPSNHAKHLILNSKRKVGL